MSDQNAVFEDFASHDELKSALDAIAASHEDANCNAARIAVRDALSVFLSDGNTRAERLLFEDGKGLNCAKRLSHVHDVMISALFDFAMKHVFKAHNITMGERIAVVAIGGYGRRTMAPGSDVDILFLLPYKQTPLGEQVAEYILYMLWDLKLKVGHATRNVDECIRLSKSDMTICTSLLEARHLTGDAQLFAELEQRFAKEISQTISSLFIKEKLAERDKRHERMGESRYVVEPNVKDGKGGLRDLHALFWISKMFYQVRKRRDLVKKGVFTRAEYRRFAKCEDFLWAVRCHLHFVTNRAEERLSFDVQREIAERLGYREKPGMENVERFMKHYYLIAKEVGDLTRIFCALLEEREVKQAPRLNTVIRNVLPFRRTRKIRGEPDFIIDNQRINAAEEDVFERDPVNMLRMFDVADQHGLEYHPDLLNLLRKSLKHLKKAVAKDPRANEHFMNVLTSTRNPEMNLRRMNEAGVLGRFIRDFGKVVAMMQFNMYHHYTVDEHLIRSVGVLSSIEQKKISDEHPLASRLLPTLDENERTILFVTLLLHDIAKGRPEDHSIAGARVARRLCPRFGMSEEDTKTVAWLIEEHLTMSMVAQSRDLNDPKTIKDFANVVQSLRRLKLLVILTVCDIRAVGPGVWNGWKGQLLRTLYAETELMLTGGYSEANRDARSAAARDRLVAALGETTSAGQAMEYSALHYKAYLLHTDFDDQVRHSAKMLQMDQTGERVDVEVKTNAFTAITELTVICPDHPRLLAVLAAACASAGAKIDSASAFTTRDGRAIDTIFINREFKDDADEIRRGERIGHHVNGMFSGAEARAEIVRKTRRVKKNTRAFRIEPFVRINNELSDQQTVIEIEALDRPGLLYDITSVVADLGLDIRSAHITTFGEKAVDTLYVTDLTGQKVTGKPRQSRIRERLARVVDPDYAGEAAMPMEATADAVARAIS
ncbi:MAG: [protein-PII] uridylyltransferase [Pseudomonadota bacterium]